MTISEQTGQSFVEALIFSLTLIMLIKLILLLFWIWTSVLWIEHQLYQGIVCMAQQKEANQCKQNTLKQIQKLTPLGTIKSLNIKNFQNEWKGYVQWHFYKKDFFIRQTLNLPQ